MVTDLKKLDFVHTSTKGLLQACNSRCAYGSHEKTPMETKSQKMKKKYTNHMFNWRKQAQSIISLANTPKIAYKQREIVSLKTQCRQGLKRITADYYILYPMLSKFF